MVLFVLVDAQALALLSLFSVINTVIVDVWIAAIVVLMGLLFQLSAGIRYYITTRRVVWERKFYHWSKTVEIRLYNVVNVRPKVVKVKGYVLFETTPGRPPILFRRIKNDPERVKQIFLQAQSSVTQPNPERS